MNDWKHVHVNETKKELKESYGSWPRNIYASCASFNEFMNHHLLLLFNPSGRTLEEIERFFNRKRFEKERRSSVSNSWSIIGIDEVNGNVMAEWLQENIGKSWGCSTWNSWGIIGFDKVNGNVIAEWLQENIWKSRGCSMRNSWGIIGIDKVNGNWEHYYHRKIAESHEVAVCQTAGASLELTK